MVTERVEEIRRQWADNYWGLMPPELAAIGDLLTALAQAERERDNYQDMLVAAVEENAPLRAEVERLTVNSESAVRYAEKRQREAEAALARVRAALERVPNPVAYDTHGWFFCAMCYATSSVKHVQYTDLQPGHAVGHMEPEDANFPHKDDCPWLIVRAALEGRDDH